MVLLLEEGHLERQDGEHLVHIALYILDAPLLPRPYLRRYVVVDGYVGIGMHILGNVKIEARIVDKDKGVGLPLHYIALAHRHILEDGA